MPCLPRRIGLSALLPLLLAGCAENPLGEPVWSGWDNGAKPVTAYEAEGQGATGALLPIRAEPTTGGPSAYDRWTPVETRGAAPLAPLESAPLAPPPGTKAASPEAGPRADLPPDPYNSRFIQRTPPIAATGLASEVASGPTRLHKTVTQRTLPLVIAGQGTERSTSTGQ